MHDGIPYGRNQGQGQGHSREVDRQSPTGLIFLITFDRTRYVFIHICCSFVCCLFVNRITPNLTDFHKIRWKGCTWPTEKRDFAGIPVHATLGLEIGYG